MSSASSVGRVARFLAGRAREVLRKLRKEVLPEDRVPMMRMLLRGQRVTSTRRILAGDLLERRRVLPPTDPARAVDGAHGAAGIAVSTAMGHALSACVRIDEAVGGDGWDGDVARGRRCAGLH